MRRLPLFVTSLVACLLAGTAPAAAAAPKARPAAAPAAATPQLASLSKAQLRGKLASAKIQAPADLFEPQEGDEIPEMAADQTTDGFKLEYRGVKASAFDDADGTDEVAVWIAVVRATPSGYTKSIHRVTTPSVLSSKHPGTVDGATTIYDGDRTPMLLVSAAIEDDDGGGAQWMAELDMLLEQAIAAATVAREPGDDPLDVLHGMIELGRIMLGADPGRPGLDMQKIGTTDWDQLWDLDPTIDGPLDPRTAAASKPTKAPTTPRFVYKLTNDAKIGAGRYALRFDVPAAPGRKPRRVVAVDVNELVVVTPPNDLAAGSDKNYFVRVCIAQGGIAGMNIDQPATASCVTKKLAWAHSGASWEALKFYRRVRQGETKVSVFSWWTNASGSEFKFLDLDVGGLGFTKLELDVGDAPVGLTRAVTGDGEGGGSWNSQCYSCGFPSGAAIGKSKLTIRH
jgi:hypothetical protein